jgi:hypothetical protein
MHFDQCAFAQLALSLALFKGAVVYWELLTLLELGSLKEVFASAQTLLVFAHLEVADRYVVIKSAVQTGVHTQ